MQTSLKITNAKIFTRHALLSGGLVIEDGIITKIGKEPNLPQVDTTLNLNGQLVIPGIIDAHVHLRDFQLAYKETFLTGTYAAAMGGVTTVIDMPNTKPPTTNATRVLEKKQKAKDNIFTNIGGRVYYFDKQKYFSLEPRVSADYSPFSRFRIKAALM